MIQSLSIDRRTYQVEVFQRLSLPPAAPRLVIVSFLPRPIAGRVLQVCLRSIEKFTPLPHETWVIDNHSPRKELAWLRDFPGLNLVLNHTEPLPPNLTPVDFLQAAWRRRPGQRNWASYANAIGLEIARRVISPDTQYLMTLHMDTLACHPGWLDTLVSKIDERTAAAGVYLNKARTPEGVLHILGALFDYQRLQNLNLDFFPDLPHYDVGDRITVGFRQAGFGISACQNSLDNPTAIDDLPAHSIWKNFQVARFLDDHGQVIFAHLGRTIQKIVGDYPGITPEMWLNFAEEKLLTS